MPWAPSAPRPQGSPLPRLAPGPPPSVVPSPTVFCFLPVSPPQWLCTSKQPVGPRGLRGDVPCPHRDRTPRAPRATRPLGLLPVSPCGVLAAAAVTRGHGPLPGQLRDVKWPKRSISSLEMRPQHPELGSFPVRGVSPRHPPTRPRDSARVSVRAAACSRGQGRTTR